MGVQNSFVYQGIRRGYLPYNVARIPELRYNLFPLKAATGKGHRRIGNADGVILMGRKLILTPRGPVIAFVGYRPSLPKCGARTGPKNSQGGRKQLISMRL